MISVVLKIVLPSLLAFITGLIITPFLTTWMYKKRMWKKYSRQDTKTQPHEMSVAFSELHNEEKEIRTPRLGGLIIWTSIVVVGLLFYILATILPGGFFMKIDFLSRNQTLLPFIAVIFGASFGLLEDLIEIRTKITSRFAQGLPDKYLIAIVSAFGLFFGLWFFTKLDISSVFVPFLGSVELGWLFIPFFILVTLATFSSRVIDGIDGLAGGVMAIVFACFGVVALVQNQIDIATFCFVVTGSILSFLWFNVPPARFYMGETGMLSLVLSLTVITFLLDKVLLLLVIGFPLSMTAFSSAVQIFSKKYFNRKVFKVAPIHHHFQSLGWSNEKVVMRYWIFSVMMGVLGIILAIIG